MPRFSGEYQETFTVDVPLESAKKHFGDPEVIAKHHGEPKRWEQTEPGTIHYVMVPKSEKGVTFNGEYTCKYEFTDDNAFAWRTVGAGNMWSNGSAKFTAVGDSKTRITWSQSMECEMQVNRILAKMIKGIVSSQIAKGSKEFLGRMRSSLR